MLGSGGVMLQPVKKGVVDKELVQRIAKSMATLNKKASELMQEIGVHACTDVTGFGLLGHAAQVAENSQICIELHLAQIPYFPEVVSFAQQ